MSSDPALSKEAKAALRMHTEQAEKRLRPHRAPPANARELALRGILRVLYEGAYSQLTLGGLLTDVEDGAVRSHTTRLFYGCLERLWRLDAELRRLAVRDPANFDPEVLTVLRLGLYELRYTNTHPAAVVHSAVETVKRFGFGSAASLVNGLLRRADRETPRLPRQLWLEVSAHPEMVLDLSREIAPDRLRAYLSASLEPQPLSVRLRDATIDRHEPPYRPSPYREDFAFYDPSVGGPLAVHPDFRSGRITSQGLAAGLAADFLDPQPGERIFDACAAPGNKTLGILDRGAEVIAQDVHLGRLGLIRDLYLRAARPSQLKLRLNDPEAVSLLPKGLLRNCDRVLADVPCSGLGMLAGKPELRIFYDRNAAVRLSELQLNLLKQAYTALKPGGKLLYSTCTLLRAENSAVIERFASAEASAERTALGAGRKTSELLLVGDLSPAEGFFYAALKRREA